MNAKRLSNPNGAMISSSSPSKYFPAKIPSNNSYAPNAPATTRTPIKKYSTLNPPKFFHNN